MKIYSPIKQSMRKIVIDKFGNKQEVIYEFLPGIPVEMDDKHAEETLKTPSNAGRFFDEESYRNTFGNTADSVRNSKVEAESGNVPETIAYTREYLESLDKEHLVNILKEMGNPLANTNWRSETLIDKILGLEG